MIKLRHQEGIYRPVILCDICEQQITDASEGNAVSKNHQGGGQVDFQQVMHVHMGRCTDVAEVKLGGKSQTGFDNLDIHLLTLMYSVGLPPEQLLKLQKMREDHGLL